MTSRDRAKKIIGGIYSLAANRLYEPLVVRTAFPLFGGDLNDLVLEQGRRAVSVAGTRPILDMPIGTAYFTLAAAGRHEGLVVGCDIAAGMVKKAKASAARDGIDNLEAVQADAHHLPFDDGCFGAILCTNGLQVIPGLDETMSELARVLAPDGRLYVSAVTMPMGALLPEQTAERLPTLFKSRREISAALDRVGLRVTSVETNRFAVLLEATKASAGS